MSSVAIDTDPLTLLHNSIEKCFTDSAVMKQAVGLVLEKNFIGFNKLRDTEEYDVNSEVDVPSLKLVFTGGASDINLASNLCQWNPVYNLILNTGEQMITKSLYPVLFAVYCTLATRLHGNNPVLTGLTWQGQTFCKNFRIGTSTVGVSNPVINRGIKGWTAICSITFNLAFNRSSIENWAGV